MVLRKEIALQIKNLLKENPQGLSITDIVKVVTINRNTAGRYLENLLISGQVEMRRLGMAKIYMLSQRVPLSAVLSISSELVMQLDSSLRIIFANEPFLKLVRTDSKNLLGKNIEYTPVALVFDDLFPGFHENIREGLTGKEWSGEIALSTKDIILFCRIAPTVFDDGQKGVSVILEDITDEKRAELSLQESEDRYRTLVEISPDAVFLHREGTIIYANPAALKLLGASHSNEVIGKNVLGFIHPDFHDSVMKNIEKDLGDEITPPIELHMLRIDGTSIIVEGRGVKTFIYGKPAIQVALRDITESKRAEEVLRESEEKYRTLVERANDVICIIQDGIIKMCNPRLAEYWGGSVEEILGRPFTDFIHPDVLSEIADRYHRRMAGESPPSIFETILMRKDGSRSYGEVNAGIISYEGKPADLIIVRDINERKKAQEALKESEELYRHLYERAPFGIGMANVDGKILASNRTMELITGFSAEEFKAINLTDIYVNPDDRAELVETLKTSGSVVDYPAILKRKDGTEYNASLTIGFVNIAGKNVIQTLVQDVTARMRSEDALRDSEATSGALINAWTDPVILLDMQRIILALNETAAVQFGRRTDELIGVLLDDLFPAEIARTRRSFIAQVIEKKDVMRFEDEHNGRWYDTVAYPITSGTGEVIKIAIIARDITERRNI